MALLVNNKGEREFLARVCGRNVVAGGDTLILRLYKNIHTIAEGDSINQFIMSNGTGYAPITLSPWNFTIATTGDSTNLVYPQQTFTYSGGDSLNGYMVTGFCWEGDTAVMWAEQFTDGPYVIPAGGGTVKITLKLTLE